MVEPRTMVRPVWRLAAVFARQVANARDRDRQRKRLTTTLR